jgi:hypothetical protein
MAAQVASSGLDLVADTAALLGERHGRVGRSRPRDKCEEGADPVRDRERENAIFSASFTRNSTNITI